MWNCISSPEDNILERYFGFIVQFFALTMCIGPLVPKQNVQGPKSTHLTSELSCKNWTVLCQGKVEMEMANWRKVWPVLKKLYGATSTPSPQETHFWWSGISPAHSKVKHHPNMDLENWF